MADPLYIEVFTEYGLSICLIFLRFFARFHTVGIRAFDVGDLFAGLACIFYSLETAGIYLLSQYGNNVGLNEKTAMEVPEEDVPRLTLGSKIVFMNWLWYITLIWCLKGVLLALYLRMGRDITKQERLTKIVSIFVFFTWLGCMLCHITICTPPWKTWQIKPYPGDNCTVRGPDYIVIAVLNVVSDLAIMAVPTPLLWTVRIPLKRKLAMSVIFALGFFVMIATILRAYYSLVSLTKLPIALGWASRETFAATIAATAPGIKPLFTKSRWLKSSSQGGSRGTNLYGSGKANSKYHAFSDPTQQCSTNTRVSVDREHANTRGQAFELKYWGRSNHAKARRYSSSESDERIIMDEERSENKVDGKDHDRDIYVTTEYTVKHQEPGDRI